MRNRAILWSSWRAGWIGFEPWPRHYASLLVASLLAYQGVENFAVYAAAKAYVLRLGEALHRELKRDGMTVTALCPGMSDTGFAKAARQKITPALKQLMMQPAPVVRAGIRALLCPAGQTKPPSSLSGQRRAGCTKRFSLAL
jgi:short-subunit dehydrogenase